MTLLGIALPVYNGAKYIREALDSILAQDYEDFILLVSDNCSTDRTPDILAEYASKDSRIKVSRSYTFMPQAENVNRSVELCDATWVKLFCHDDIMLPGCLSKIYNTIIHYTGERVGLVGDATGWQFINGYRYSPYSQDDAEPICWNGIDLIKREVSGKSSAPLPALSTATVRRQAFIQSRRFDSRYLHFDVFLWAYLLLEWDYIYIPQFITITRIHGGQVAVDARKSMRTAKDLQHFWPAFVQENSHKLNLDLRVYLRSILKGPSAASYALAIAMLKHQVSGSLILEVIRTVPIYLLPLIPLLIFRSLHSESKRLLPLRNHVPLEMIYPS